MQKIVKQRSSQQCYVAALLRCSSAERISQEMSRMNNNRTEHGKIEKLAAVLQQCRKFKNKVCVVMQKMKN